MQGTIGTLVVAVDGPSGSGKSSTSRGVARRLGLRYLDTGAMYRAVTWHFLQEGCAPAECAGDPDRGQDRMQRALQQARLELSSGRLLLNGRDVTSHLRTREVESQVSAVSALPFVRSAMRDLQRQVAARGPVVAEGRDMGTVVFPKAHCKIFLDASVDERARRRKLELEAGGRRVDIRALREEIAARDHNDRSRQIAPLRPAEDATTLDTTGMDLDRVVDEIVRLAKARA